MTRALGIPAEVSRRPLSELSVWLSLDDLIGHYETSCFLGDGNMEARAGGRAAGDVLAAVLLAFALSFLSAAPGHIAGTATAAAFVAVAHAAAA
jgi:hypothetical protein